MADKCGENTEKARLLKLIRFVFCPGPTQHASLLFRDNASLRTQVAGDTLISPLPQNPTNRFCSRRFVITSCKRSNFATLSSNLGGLPSALVETPLRPTGEGHHEGLRDSSGQALGGAQGGDGLARALGHSPPLGPSRCVGAGRTGGPRAFERGWRLRFVKL